MPTAVAELCYVLLERHALSAWDDRKSPDLATGVVDKDIAGSDSISVACSRELSTAALVAAVS